MLTCNPPAQGIRYCQLSRARVAPCSLGERRHRRHPPVAYHHCKVFLFGSAPLHNGVSVHPRRAGSMRPPNNLLYLRSRITRKRQRLHIFASAREAHTLPRRSFRTNRRFGTGSASTAASTGLLRMNLEQVRRCPGLCQSYRHRARTHLVGKSPCCESILEQAGRLRAGEHRVVAHRCYRPARSPSPKRAPIE